jgi:hypothetical protein
MINANNGKQDIGMIIVNTIPIKGTLILGSPSQRRGFIRGG